MQAEPASGQRITVCHSPAARWLQCGVRQGGRLCWRTWHIQMVISTNSEVNYVRLAMYG